MTRVLVAVSTLGILLVTGPAAFAENCLDRLGFQPGSSAPAISYTCQVKSSAGGSATTNSLVFWTNGSVRWSAYNSFNLPCLCGTDGSFKNPKFNHSLTKWQCLNAGTGSLGESAVISLQGSVGASGKITKVAGQTYINDFGLLFENTYLFDCDLD